MPTLERFSPSPRSRQVTLGSSPRRRLGESPVPVAHRRRELRRLKGAGADLLDKIDMRQQCAAWPFVGVPPMSRPTGGLPLYVDVAGFDLSVGPLQT